MSIIEQATRRLEELRRAGIDVPWVEPPGGIATANAAQDVAPSVTSKAHETLVKDARAVPAQVQQPKSAPAAAAPEPVEARTSRAVEIALANLAMQGYLTPATTNRVLADEFRVIKMQLIKTMKAAAASGSKRSNLILVTSSMPGEGKTFVSINLAMSLAMEVDLSVLLVDADVLRPAVMERLGLHSSLGLLDLVTRTDLEVADVMLRTNVPKLSLIAAGTQTHKSTELLASDGMERLLTELSERYSDRIIVFDAPPLLVATEARQLASRVGEVLMVVEANRTDSATVSKAFAAVESCSNVSSVLNRCPTVSMGAGYGAYYRV